MTLIIGAAFKNQFIAMTTDSKVTIHEYGINDFESSEIKSEKVLEPNLNKIKIIGNNVLLATAGIVDTGEVVINELNGVINSNDNLESCIKKLQDIVFELWNKKKSFWKGGLLDRPSMSLNFLGTKQFSCMLFGFLENGNAGIAYLNPDSLKVDLLDASEGLGTMLIAPKVDDKFKNWIQIPNDEDRNLQNIRIQLITTHAKLSYDYSSEISSDCHLFYIVKNKNNKSEVIEELVETNVFHEMFKEQPEIDFNKFYRGF